MSGTLGKSPLATTLSVVLHFEISASHSEMTSRKEVQPFHPPSPSPDAYTTVLQSRQTALQTALNASCLLFSPLVRRPFPAFISVASTEQVELRDCLHT